MGNLCSCNFITGEDKKEFNGFSSSSNNDDKFIYIIKKQFNKYNEKDKKYYKKLSEEEIKKISDLFNELEETPGLVLNDNGKSKDEFKKKKINLFFIILFFRLFNEEDFQKSFKNILIKEDTEKKIYKGLAK